MIAGGRRAERRPSGPALLGWIALACLLGAAHPPQEKEEPPAEELPNIVLVLADDLGWGDPRCYNPHSKIATPNIDRLAREGLRLTDAHTPSGVCTPTRYGLLTGRYAWRTRLKRGVLWGDSPCLLEPGRTTLASLLRRHGYATMCIGKWHLGLGSGKTDYSKPLRPGPLDFGFDGFFGIPASLDMPPYVLVEDDRPIVAATRRTKGSDLRRVGGGGFWRAGPIAPGFVHSEVLPTLTEQAVTFIARQAAREERTPFFLYFPLTAPHTPWLPTEAFEGKTGAGPYGDFAALVDHALGRVLEALDRHELSANTLVIFSSDNGAHWTPGDLARYGHRANAAWRGQKADIWEGGHRVPFLARWPGKIEAGMVRDELFCLTDLMATFAAIVGDELGPEEGVDSFDQLPVLMGAELEQPTRGSIVHHSFEGMFAIRESSWKLILGRGSGGFSYPVSFRPPEGEPEGQLYDLSRDPAEAKNLHAERPEIVKRLRSLLEQQASQGFSRGRVSDD